MTEAYDSVTSATLRLMRRKWIPLTAVAVVLGAAGWAVGGDTSSVSGTATLSVNDDQQADLDAAVDLVAVHGQVNVDAAAALTTATATALPDRDADTLNVSVRAPSAQEADQTLATYIELLDARAVQPVVDRAAAVLAGLEEKSAAQDALVRDLEERLANGTDDAGVTAAVVVELAQARRDLSDLAVEIRAAELFIADASEVQITAVGASWSTPSLLPLNAIAGVVGGIVVAVLLCVALVLFDGRVRRRLHLIRASGAVPVVGLLPRDDAAGAQRLAAAIDRWADPADRILVIGPTKGVGEQTVATLVRELLPDRSVEVAGGRVPGECGDGHVAALLVAEFGITKEHDVNAACADLLALGVEQVGTVLTDVPRRDVVWAGVQPNEE